MNVVVVVAVETSFSVKENCLLWSATKRCQTGASSNALVSSFGNATRQLKRVENRSAITNDKFMSSISR